MAGPASWAVMTTAAVPSPAVPSLAQGRLCIVLAALLWSTSGAFTKVLTQDTALGLNSPRVPTLQIACLRVLFASLVLAPALRRRDLSFHPLMLSMIACFAVMNATFGAALDWGTAANAIVLQYTAPVWLFLAGVCWLGERADVRGVGGLALGLAGVAVIVAGGWTAGELPVVGIALVSGLAYAGVLVHLRLL